MKIALVSPHFPPDHCGVGDYTDRLAGNLARAGHEITVWTAQMAPERREGFLVRSHAAGWGASALSRIGREILAWRPDAVVIQYTPYLYARYGVQPLLPPWIGWLRARLGRKTRVALTAHELHYPLGLSPDRLLLGTPQFALFQALACAADRVFFTYDSPLKRYSARFPWKKSRFSWLPAGANILPDSGAQTHPGRQDMRALMQTARVPQKHKVLLHFGTRHPTRLFDPLFETLEAVRKNLGPDSASLVFAGMDSKTVEEELRRAGKMDLAPFARGLGYVPEWQASLWLKRADVVVSPFLDGVSARRCSVIAALAHQAPVVTNRGWATDPELWDGSTELLETADPAQFAGATLKLLSDPARAQSIGRAGRERFEKNLSWEFITEEMTRRLS